MDGTNGTGQEDTDFIALDLTLSGASALYVVMERGLGQLSSEYGRIEELKSRCTSALSLKNLSEEKERELKDTLKELEDSLAMLKYSITKGAELHEEVKQIARELLTEDSKPKSLIVIPDHLG